MFSNLKTLLTTMVLPYKAIRLEYLAGFLWVPKIAHALISSLILTNIFLKVLGYPIMWLLDQAVEPALRVLPSIGAHFLNLFIDTLLYSHLLLYPLCLVALVVIIDKLVLSANSSS